MTSPASPASAGPTLRTLGAAGTVTGSMHLVERGDERVLLDCGLYQGRREEARRRNKQLPLDAKAVTSVVLSHAHIDHSGNLPTLVKSGFAGPIYVTSATADLARILLEDSAEIQARDADYYNRRMEERGSPDRIEPLYGHEEVREVIDRFHAQPYGRPFEVAHGMRATFRDAGHILGSAMVYLEVDRKDGATRRLLFTGDVGRRDLPILRDPELFPAADLILTESTYGDRLHPTREDAKARLADAIGGAVKRRGKVLVPAFSVGRTQNLVYWLHELEREGKLPRVEVFVDSPLSSLATLVYRGHPECYDAETHATFLQQGRDPLSFSRLTYIESVQASKALNRRDGPCVIIASSGMCEAGRILHHLRQHAPDPRSLILLVGFMAEHTLGRRLAEGADELRIFGDMIPRKATVVTIGGLSAHADRDELLALFERLAPAERPRALCVHGEPASAEAFAAALRAIGTDASVPAPGDLYPI